MAKKDLLKRSLSGTVFIAVLVAALFCAPLMLLVSLVSLCFMLHEFYGISLGGNFRLERAMAFVCCCTLYVILFLVQWCGIPLRWIAVAIVPMFLMMVSLLFEKSREALDSFAYIFEGMVYIGVPVSLLPFLLFRTGEYDGTLMLGFLVILCLSDTGAYIWGTAFGQKPDSRKLAPSISPKKSWIGFWAGVINAMAASVAVYFLGWLDGMSLWQAVLFAALLSASGVCGDLFESVWKRHFGVKDSGNSIPGHGGFLDRFDSSLAAIPVAIAFLAVFGLL